MERRDILSKAFEIMLENHKNNLDFCHDLDGCDECPFYEYHTCPNLIEKKRV